MNAPENETRPDLPGLAGGRIADLPKDLIEHALPIGTFAGPQDFVLRFHDGKLVATNSGEQGGGQN